MAAKYYRGLVFCEPSLLYIPIADFVFPLSTTRVFPLSSRRRPDYAAAVQSTMAQGRMHALATVLALPSPQENECEERWFQQEDGPREQERAAT
jgi:hypothetical protein